MMTKEEAVANFLEALEPDTGWTTKSYLQYGNLLAATLPEIIKRVNALKPDTPITEALTDEQIETVEDEIEEARRRG